MILDGKSLSESILSDLKLKIKDCRLKINLHVILVGHDPASLKYVALKEKKCHEIGIKFNLHHLPDRTSESELLDLVKQLNNNSEVSGFFIQLPLPSHLNTNNILDKISARKDVDGLTSDSPYMPAVVNGIIQLLQHNNIEFANKNIVIINDSRLIGQPLKKYFDSQSAYVTLANHLTQNLSEVTTQADILISATGVKNLITSELVKEGAIVLDVANGDVDFANVAPKTAYITPTFGGIGPMTIASLLSNTVTISLNEQN